MKSVLVLVCVMAVVAAVSADPYSDLIKEEWDAFKLQYGKKYENEVEEEKRMKVYLEDRQNIAKHNQLFDQGFVTYKLAQNEFADFHLEELLDMEGFKNAIQDTESGNKSKILKMAYMQPLNVAHVPSHVNWVISGAVTTVKNQYNCKCGWAFSATGALEGQHFRKTGWLEPLSEQNLIDCSKAFGNKGCKGGTPVNAYKYIEDNGGIDTEEAYPYNAVDTVPCRYDPAFSGAEVTGYVEITKNDEAALLSAVATMGPVSALIDASQTSFKSYTHGVYYDEKCSSTDLNHGVLIVGYGTDETLGDYWLVKNSWGTSWGEFGYIKMARNKKNNCGIATAASYPTV